MVTDGASSAVAGSGDRAVRRGCLWPAVMACASFATVVLAFRIYFALWDVPFPWTEGLVRVRSLTSYLLVWAWSLVLISLVVGLERLGERCRNPRRLGMLLLLAVAPCLAYWLHLFLGSGGGPSYRQEPFAVIPIQLSLIIPVLVALIILAGFAAKWVGKLVPCLAGFALICVLVSVFTVAPPHSHPGNHQRYAIGRLQIVVDAQRAFQRAKVVDKDGDGIGDYGTLEELADPGTGSSFIHPELCSGERIGYTFTMEVIYGTATTPPGYACKAVPLRPPGYRHFSVDQTGVLRSGLEDVGPSSDPIPWP